MAVVGSGLHKGGNGSGGRGRPYAVMLLLAFGAALMGVMVVHKLRERRIFNLLVKEKDRDLLSLQLLFQKEREHSKEMRKKAEETKAKIYSLRTQKMELDRRLIEMQSIIDSLKDEQKTLELALEEKQIEIKMLREKSTDDSEKDDHTAQVIALMESLKQKESEIESLRDGLELPAPRVGSVSTTTDSSKEESVYLTSTGNLVKQKEDAKLSSENGMQVISSESKGSTDGASLGNGEVGNEQKSTTDLNEEENRKRNEQAAEEKDNGEKLQKPEIMQENNTNTNGSDTSNEASQQHKGNNEDSQGQAMRVNVSDEAVIGVSKQEQEAVKTTDQDSRKLEDDLQGGENYKELQASTEGGTRQHRKKNNGCEIEDRETQPLKQKGQKMENPC